MSFIKIFESEMSMTIKIIDIIKLELKKKKYLSLAFSGGKTPIRLFKSLATSNINWENIHIFLVDERYVPLDHTDSNYCMINKFLLKYINIPIENIHPIPYLLSIEDSKKKYLSDIFQYFKDDIVFDIIFLGIGSDGHTASIFEENEVDLVEDVIITSSKRHPYKRISLGMNTINNSKRKIFLIGPEKIPIIKSSSFKNLPGSHVTDSQIFSYKK